MQPNRPASTSTAQINILQEFYNCQQATDTIVSISLQFLLLHLMALLMYRLALICKVYTNISTAFKQTAKPFQLIFSSISF